MGGKAVELETFYSELFGWSINSNSPLKYGIVDTGGAPGGINSGVGAAHDGGLSGFRSMPGLAICRQRWTKRRSQSGKTILAPTGGARRS